MCVCVCVRTSEQKTGFQACLIAVTNSMEQSPSRGTNRSAASHEINYILRNSKLHYLAHKSTPTLHILSQMNTVQALQFYFLRIHFNIVLPSTPTSSKRLHPSGFPSKAYLYCLSIPCVPHVPPISSTFLRLQSYATQFGIFCLHTFCIRCKD